VVVDSSRCGKVVHGGAVLGAVMGSSEWARVALRGGSTVAVEISSTEGGTGRGRRKEAPRWGEGGWAPFIAARGGGRGSKNGGR
jgi:hypothetical protein